VPSTPDTLDDRRSRTEHRFDPFSGAGRLEMVVFANRAGEVLSPKLIEELKVAVGF
jgi:hypothetical protein